MNELLQTYAEKALVWLEQGAAFIQGEMPGYVEELLKWKTANAVVWLVLGIVILILGVVLLCRGIYDGDFDEFSIGIIVIGCSLPFIMYNTLKLLQITLAPRVFLLEYLTNMLN